MNEIFNPNKVDSQCFVLSSCKTRVTNPSQVNVKFYQLHPWRYAFGETQVDPLREKNHKFYYWEIKLLKDSPDLYVGIVASNISTDPEQTKYMRIPVISAWNFRYGQILLPEKPIAARNPPREGDTVGFLLDYLTPSNNGCIRLFHNGQEITINNGPLIAGLKNRKKIYATIPPFSLAVIVCADKYFPTADFGIEIVQNPRIPVEPPSRGLAKLNWFTGAVLLALCFLIYDAMIGFV